MRARALALVAACAVALAGCGGSDSDPGSRDSGEAPSGGAPSGGPPGEGGAGAGPTDGGGGTPAGGGAAEGGAAEGESGGDSFDTRAVAIECFRREGLQASLSGGDAIQVGDSPSDPRVEFAAFTGQAVAREFRAQAEGALRIGNALVFVNEGSDEEVAKIEECLDR